MKLSIFERLVILNNLPSAGSIENAVALPMIREKVEIKNDEARRIQLKSNEKSGLVWNEKKAKDKDVSFGKLERSILKKHYERLSEQEQLPIGNPVIISLYCKLTGASVDAIKESVIEDNEIETVGAEHVPPKKNVKK
ncbi:MAG: hypothetical protein ABSA44_09625 [Bacteroidota bacterium]